MIYQITIKPRVINFAPPTVLEEIFQNVYTIVSTAKFSVPLFREFGTSVSYLDDPDVIARSKLVGEIIEIVELYEERVLVEEVQFFMDEIDGKLYPVLTIRFKEGVNIN